MKRSRRKIAAAAGGVAVLAITALMTTPAGASATKVWDATHDFGKSPTVNPAPDKYHNAGVWSWEYGTANTPGTYQLGQFVSPATLKSECGKDVKNGSTPGRLQSGLNRALPCSITRGRRLSPTRIPVHRGILTRQRHYLWAHHSSQLARTPSSDGSLR